MRKRSNRKLQVRDFKSPDFVTRQNPVQKHMETNNRPSTQIDKKKEAKKNGDLHYGGS